MPEVGKPEKCTANTISIQNSNNKDNPTVIEGNNSKLNYFLPDHQQEADKRASSEITKATQRL